MEFTWYLGEKENLKKVFNKCIIYIMFNGGKFYSVNGILGGLGQHSPQLDFLPFAKFKLPSQQELVKKSNSSA